MTINSQKNPTSATSYNYITPLVPESFYRYSFSYTVTFSLEALLFIYFGEKDWKVTGWNEQREVYSASNISDLLQDQLDHGSDTHGDASY